MTPSEIDKALAAGLRVLKFFPASTYGGINGCKALFGPYASAGISFIPTGGISSVNLSEYADKPFIHAVGGGWLTPEEAVRSGNWGQITKLPPPPLTSCLVMRLRMSASTCQMKRPPPASVPASASASAGR